MLARLNQFMAADLRKGMFVTMLYVVLDTRHRVVSYASAGHTPMILYRADGDETFCLSPRGLPVGLPGSDAATFEQQLDVERLCLREGDLLLLYTDGITEAMNGPAKRSEKNVLAAVKEWGRESAEVSWRSSRRRWPHSPAAHRPPTTSRWWPSRSKPRHRKSAVRSSTSWCAPSSTRAPRSPRPAAGTKCRRRRTTASSRPSRTTADPQQLSVEKGAAVRRLATTRPELDARQLAELLRRPEWGGFEIAPTRLHAELRRQGLSRTAPQPGPALLAAVGEPFAASAAPARRRQRVRHGPARTTRWSPAEEVFVEHGGMRILLERAAAGAPCAVLQVEGCVDSGSCDALERLLATAVAARHGVIVDLQEVAYVSSRGWGLLAAAAHGARPDGSVVLACMRPQVREVYRMLGFEPIVSRIREPGRRRAGAGFAAGPAGARGRRARGGSGSGSPVRPRPWWILRPGTRARIGNRCGCASGTPAAATTSKSSRSTASWTR